jgi:predicted alpha/beta hydrolase family esterase
MDRVGSPDAESWHEAGHGLIAHLLGGEVQVLTLESDEDAFEGRATILWPAASPSESARRSALTALGGPLAELIFRGEVELDDPNLVRAWDGDWQEVERCAEVVQPDPNLRTNIIQRWIHEVDRQLRTARSEEVLARIADALDAHGTLDETLFEECL